MSPLTPAETRAYLAGLALANRHEIEELRSTPVETKLRQLWTLMDSGGLLEDPAEREAGVLETRRRWLLLHRSLRA